MVNYDNGKIYKIINSANENIYVGSTTKKQLSYLMCEHKDNAKGERYPEVKLYKMMREIGIDNFKIVLVELYPTESKNQLNAREEYWINELHASLNMNRAYNPKDDTYYKRYYDEHREAKIRDINKYVANNKEKIKERQLKYYNNEEIKQKIKARQQIKIHCNMCNIEFCNGTRLRHERSKSHLKILNK